MENGTVQPRIITFYAFWKISRKLLAKRKKRLIGSGNRNEQERFGAFPSFFLWLGLAQLGSSSPTTD